ncbi:MAG TPA: DUF222 domain-containing protein [Solirubrobacteraceae bacterium]|nr:DUF222 domain-containing protein [Solirubrobacteraceae bacterium]
MDLEVLEREICELAAHLAAATCRWLTLVAEFDERLGWAEWGVKSCAHWLSWRCSIGLGTARDQVRVARRLRELPKVRAAFATGELSYSKVRAIARVATPEIEEDLVAIALHASGAQLEQLVRGYHGALAVTLGTAQAALARRYLRWNWEDDGSLRIVGRLPADDGGLFLAALQAAEGQAAHGVQPTRADDEETAGPRDAAARSADALVTLARATLAGADADRTRGDPCELVVHVDAETLAGDRVHEQSRLADGPALAPETVRRLGCDASVVRIIERDGQPLSVGRRTRTIPPALRRALRARENGCRFPGCTHRRFLHAHHIQHWAHGGETKLENLVHLCSHHHRLVHEGGFAVERAGPRSLRFRRPDGRPIPPAGPCVRARGPALQDQNRVRGAVIDAYTCMPRSAGDPLDYAIAVEGLLARALAPT